MSENQLSFFAELKRRNVFRVGAAYVVMGWLVAQVTELALDSFGAPDWVMPTLLTLLLLGLPVALIFAWAFELTPDGIRREHEIDRSRSIAPETGRRLEIVTLVGLALVVTIVALDRFLPKDSTESLADRAGADSNNQQIAGNGPGPATQAAAGDNSVAVLPFANRSVRAEDAFFADGIHDDLLTQLSKISALQVISRTSVGKYRDTTKSIPSIAAELGVAAVLEGAVQRSGERVRINVQLIDGASDVHLWAENYDRTLTAENLFEIQAEITRGIANALEAVLTGTEQQSMAQVPTQSVAAYDAFVRGNLLADFANTTPERSLRSIQAFEEATRLDPDFAEAWARKAISELSLFWYASRGDEYRDAALRSIQRAEALSPDGVDTLIARGYYHYWGFLQYEAADGYLDRALALAPNNTDALQARAFVARRDGRFADAVAALERVHKLDPLKLESIEELAGTYDIVGQLDDAARMLQRAADISPDSTYRGQNLARYYSIRGDSLAAYEANLDSPSGDAASDYLRVWYAIGLRDPEKVEFHLANWPEAGRRQKGSEEAYELASAMGLQFLGRHEEARRILREVKARLDQQDTPYSAGWAHNAVYRPVVLPGLLGDLDGVNRAVAELESISPRDEYALLDVTYQEITAAYVRAGDPESALDYMEKNLTGYPWLFPRYGTHPDFDSLRDYPRYLALEAAFNEWQGGQP